MHAPVTIATSLDGFIAREDGNLNLLAKGDSMKILTIALLFTARCFAGAAEQDSVFVVVSGDTATIWNTRVGENCASRFAFSIVMLDSNDILLTEIDTVGPIALCTCIYDLSVSLNGLGPGTYPVSVYRQYQRQVGYPKDSTRHIGSTEFIITGPQSSSQSLRYYQSECREVESSEDPEGLPHSDALAPNYPNPFNPTTVIEYSTSTTGNVKLKVVDLLGREMVTLVDGVQRAGLHRVNLDAGGFPAGGVYFYILSTGNVRRVGKMLLVR